MSRDFPENRYYFIPGYKINLTERDKYAFIALETPLWTEFQKLGLKWEKVGRSVVGSGREYAGKWVFFKSYSKV